MSPQARYLNFGYTFGHAIEKLAGYGQWLHGEAVAIGMVMAAELGGSLTGFLPVDARRLRRLLEQLGLPVSLDKHDLKVEDMINAMGMDKKVSDGRLKFVLARSLGDVIVSDAVGLEVLRELLSEQMA